MKQPKIIIGESAGFFTIQIDGKDFSFDQKDVKSNLIDVFEHLGFTDVTYEEWY